MFGRTQVLEVNPDHPIIQGLWRAVQESQPQTDTENESESSSSSSDEAGVAPIIVNQLFDNAQITAGLVDDPRRMLGQLNDLMLAALPQQDKE